MFNLDFDNSTGTFVLISLSRLSVRCLFMIFTLDDALSSLSLLTIMLPLKGSSSRDLLLRRERELASF